MNALDLVMIVLLVLAAVRGYRRGLLGQAFEFGGGFIGLVLGIVVGPRIASTLTDQAGVGAALISLIAVFVFLSLGQTVGYIVGHRFGTAARSAHLGAADAALGVGFSAIVTLLSLWLIGSLLIGGPSRALSRQLQGSTLFELTNDVLPHPPDVLAYLRQYLETSGFPQVFAGLPRPPGPPARLPSQATARRAVQAADQSTVRVVAPACGGTQFGSGWVAAPSTVVTNAHVVAGGEQVTVQDGAGNHPASVVLFDPETDVAILRSAGLDGPPLSLGSQALDRGAQGATLGYPNGGPLTPKRAAVQARFSAAGRDIYGRSTVTREIYELRSTVRPGDSGGPFVTPGGQVAGVVFAASTLNGDVGYALTAEEVADEVRRGAERTQPVSTGGCTR